MTAPAEAPEVWTQNEYQYPAVVRGGTEIPATVYIDIRDERTNLICRLEADADDEDEVASMRRRANTICAAPGLQALVIEFAELEFMCSVDWGGPEEKERRERATDQAYAIRDAAQASAPTQEGEGDAG